MLDLSRLEARQTAANIEVVDIESLIEEVVSETQRTHDKPPVRLSYARAPVPATRTDALKLRMIVANLVENAVKFTDQGTVTIATRNRDGGVEISVSDTGIGIDPAIRDVIFEAFRQGETASTRRFEGAGLGLYIVRRFVEILGGTIALDSEVGRGSTFRVWIPRHEAA
jgi:signal transduction histidine kinase